MEDSGTNWPYVVPVKNRNGSQPRVGARLWSGDTEIHDGVVSFQ